MAAQAGPPQGFLRARTTTVDKATVDFMVLQHTCVDSSMIPALGAHKEFHWVIAVGPDAVPLDIKLTVDKSVVKDPLVGVVCNGELVFPDPNVTGKGDMVNGKLQRDFIWQMAFRGMIEGLNLKNNFEVRPEHLGIETWYPATLIEQREDGLFKANVAVPQRSGGDKTVVYPAVNPANIRHTQGSNDALVVPRRAIVLTVPKSDPMLATLSIDGSELVTHFFARPTPAPAVNGQLLGRMQRTKIDFQVSKDRKMVSCSVGHTVLAWFLSGEARTVSEECDKLRHSWTLRVGPFATHTIVLEKKYKSSKVVTLTVDNSTLAEGSAEDLESPEGYWFCSFRLLGEKSLNWEVFESDGNGRTLDSKGVVERVTQYQSECTVFVANGENLVEARLCIDGQDFANLKPANSNNTEKPLSLQPEALVTCYNLEVPYKCKDDAVKKNQSTTSPMSGGGVLDLFSCCGTNQADQTSDLVLTKSRQ